MNALDTSGVTPPDREQRLDEAVTLYFAALAEGREPNRRAILDQYHDLAEELDRFFTDQEQLDRLTDPLRAVARAARLRADVLYGVLPPAPQDPNGDAGRPPQQLGDFRILREIGRGGMGVVYEAEQVSLGRSVALKILSFASTFDSRQLQRFQNEARAAALLHHTNIVPVYSVGCDKGVHYYAMQFVDGQSLADVFRELRRASRRATSGAIPPDMPTGTFHDDQPAAGDATAPSSGGSLTPPVQSLVSECSIQSREFFHRVAQLGVQAAEAIDHAHQMGIVHRDIKPANLLLDSKGNLWITDFGLAQFKTGPDLTTTGDLVGTIRYMSPEQALAKRAVIDHRTDIYSLGVTMYELLTLEHAFADDDRNLLLRRIATEEPRSPRRLNQHIPADLETIILKAIAKNPAERYETAQALADDLRRFIADQSIHARRPTLVQRIRRWARRHPTFVATAAVFAALTIVGLAVGTILLAREKSLTAAAWKAEERQRLLTEQTYRIGRRYLSAAHMVLAHQAVEGADIGRACTF